MTADRTSELASRIRSSPAVCFALLFGSRSKQRARSASDWDVGVFLEEELDPGQRFELRRHLLAALAPEYDIDLVVLNEAPPLLAHRALLGEPLFVRDRTPFVRFAVRTLSRVGDEQYWRALHTVERATRLREHRFGRP